jgi:hypothetical protein
MEQQRINNEADFHNKSIGIEQQNADTNAKLAGVHQAALPATKQPWNQDQFDKLKTNLAMKGLPVDSLDAVLTPISQMANNPAMKRGDVANAIQQNWSNPVDPADPSKGTTGFQTDLNNGLQTKIMSLAQKASGLQDNDPQKKPLMDQINKLQAIKAQFNTITPDNVKQAFFPDVAQEEANTKAALRGQGDQERAARLNPDTQFMASKTQQYINSGMSQEDANTKAYQDLSTIKAAQAKAGRAVTTIGAGSAGAPASTTNTSPAATHAAVPVAAQKSGAIPGDYNLPQPTAAATASKPGFFSDVNNDLVKRGVAIADELDSPGTESLGQTLLKAPQRTLRIVGQAAGFVGDLEGDAKKSAYETLTPDSVQDAVKTGVKNILNSDVGKMGIAAAKAGYNQYEAFKKQYPNISKDLEAAVNIALLYPIEGKVGTAKDIAEAGIEAGKYAIHSSYPIERGNINGIRQNSKQGKIVPWRTISGQL